jgi:hypothetical protein
LLPSEIACTALGNTRKYKRTAAEFNISVDEARFKEPK